jgi:hypothetical protein
MDALIRVPRGRPSLSTSKKHKNNLFGISKREKPTLLQQSAKFKHSAPQRKRVFREKDKTVKKTLVRALMVVAVLVVCGSSPVMADGGPLPSCKPPLVCLAR